MTEWQEVSWDYARNIAGEVVQRLKSEEVSLADARNRILADDTLALCDLPTYTTSAMDGWAVSGEGPW